MLTDGLNFLLKGGPVMTPLFLCAIISVTVMLERWWVLSRAQKGGRTLVREIRPALEAGRDRAALERLQYAQGPVARILEVAIQNGAHDRRRIEQSIEEVASEEMPALSRGLSVLDTIITVSPLLGLLGTVTGMIKAFQIVALTNGMNAPSKITGGVAEALIATATGLAIAIVTLVGYNALSDRVKNIVSDMETAATKVVNIIDVNRSAAAAPMNGAAPAGLHRAGAPVQPADPSLPVSPRGAGQP